MRQWDTAHRRRRSTMKPWPQLRFNNWFLVALTTTLLSGPEIFAHSSRSGTSHAPGYSSAKSYHAPTHSSKASSYGKTASYSTKSHAPQYGTSSYRPVKTSSKSPRKYAPSQSQAPSKHSTSGSWFHPGGTSSPRDQHGHIKRNPAAKREFMRESGYPHGRPGYVVDHIVPLKRGGADSPSNMQWQTKEEAKRKDKWE